MSDAYRNLINGEWKASKSGEIFHTINPANNEEIVGSFQKSTVDDVREAIDAAHAAFPAWRAMHAGTRGDLLLKAAAILRTKVDDITAIMTKEMGKIVAETRGETLRAALVLEWAAGEGRRINGETFPSDQPNTFLYTVKEPLGVVGLITPWNFPIAIPAWKMAPALVTGNTVVIKPASNTPLTCIRLIEALVEAGLPPGVVNIVTGSGSVVGNEIVDNQKVKAISFTGSNAVGQDLYSRGSRRLAKVQCEMGGKNPIIVCEDADIDVAVACTVASAMLTTGQKCTACSRVIVMKSIMDIFLEKVLEEVKKYKVGDGFDESVKVGPQVDENQLNTVLEYIAIGKQEGATLAYGGQHLTTGAYAKGYFVEPTVFTNVTPDMRIAKEEIFGPVLAVMAANDLDDALSIANSVEYGLAASLHSKDIEKIHRFTQNIQAGLVHVNSGTIGAEVHVPFGGYKGSSTGSREQGTAAIDFYTQTKTVYLHYK